jgi:hypothetical protein
MKAASMCVVYMHPYMSGSAQHYLAESLGFGISIIVEAPSLQRLSSWCCSNLTRVHGCNHNANFGPLPCLGTCAWYSIKPLKFCQSFWPALCPRTNVWSISSKEAQLIEALVAVVWPCYAKLWLLFVLQNLLLSNSCEANQFCVDLCGRISRTGKMKYVQHASHTHEVVHAHVVAISKFEWTLGASQFTHHNFHILCHVYGVMVACVSLGLHIAKVPRPSRASPPFTWVNTCGLRTLSISKLDATATCYRGYEALWYTTCYQS